jgi:diadenosine tetraphosphate (Ap4A) HIT family hydrolase
MLNGPATPDPSETDPGCVFCERVRSVETFRDLVVFEDEEFLVSHQIGDDGSKALGVLHVQTKRHVPSLGHLSAVESNELGRLLASLSKGLETRTGAPWTYCFGFTEGPRHVHMVLGSRYAALPEPYLRLRFAEWPEGPRGDRGQIARLASALREDVAREMGLARRPR